jgi:PTH1 family peptidyl-tRNA hydrolase
MQRHAPGQTPKAKFQSAAVETQIETQIETQLGAGRGAHKCLFLKPNTYMNLSGRAVGEAVRFHKLDAKRDLIVVLDDVALPVGAVRVRAQGGTGGHNGLADIQRALGNGEYARIRIGIGASPSFMDQADYVLGKFTEMERPAIDAAVERAASAVETFVAEGIDAAMNKFNAPEDQGAGQDQTHPGWFSDKSTQREAQENG